MDFFTTPVAYLDTNDFDDNGNLINPLIPTTVPVFIMIQANFCGYCKIAKPDFQTFAQNNLGKFFCASIQADSQNPDVQALKNKMGNIYPGLQGFPSYIIFFQGKRIIYSGGRKLSDLQAFADGFPAYFATISQTKA